MTDNGRRCGRRRRAAGATAARGSRRLFWRVYLHGVMLLVLVLIATVVFGALLRHGRASWHQRVAGLVSYAGTLCGQQHAAGDTSAAGRGATREIDRLSQHMSLRVSCYDAQGKLVVSGGGSDGLSLLDAAVRRRIEGADQPVHVSSPHGLGAAVREGTGAVRGYVVVGLISEGQSPVSRFVVLLAVVLAVLALGSVPLVRAIVAPVERLTVTAKAVGGGDLSARTGVKRGDELGQLAGAFDEMVARLEQLVRSEKELLANVSHELRTPLARIRVALELADEGEAEAARRYLGEIGADLGELERLVEDLLTTAQLDLAAAVERDGAPALRQEAFAPAELADRAAGRFRRAYPQAQLDVHAQAELPELRGDAMLLRRVLDNVLRNAYEHGAADAPIELRVAAEAATGGVMFAVRDRGPGIAPEDLARLFEPFFRTDRSRSRTAGGVGLGLTLCRRVIEAHGGTISADSAVGEGTTVRVSLPAPATGSG